jgi:E3 ubiquitin-protein ligase RNF139
MKRRTAVGKINSLPDASDQQLAQHNDVCAICYQEMLAAKVRCPPR